MLSSLYITKVNVIIVSFLNFGVNLILNLSKSFIHIRFNLLLLPITPKFKEDTNYLT
jgi:hypothetical protein